MGNELVPKKDNTPAKKPKRKLYLADVMEAGPNAAKASAVFAYNKSSQALSVVTGNRALEKRGLKKVHGAAAAAIVGASTVVGGLTGADIAAQYTLSQMPAAATELLSEYDNVSFAGTDRKLEHRILNFPGVWDDDFTTLTYPSNVAPYNLGNGSDWKKLTSKLPDNAEQTVRDSYGSGWNSGLGGGFLAGLLGLQLAAAYRISARRREEDERETERKKSLPKPQTNGPKLT